MRRRSRRAPNLSESTGKIGQELPSNQLAPLVPFYADEAPAPRIAQPQRPQQEPRRESQKEPQREPDQRSQRGQEPRPAPPERAAASDRPAAPARAPRAPRQDFQRQDLARQEWSEPENASRFELETQPEMPTVPAPEP